MSHLNAFKWLQVYFEGILIVALCDKCKHQKEWIGKLFTLQETRFILVALPCKSIDVSFPVKLLTWNISKTQFPKKE